MALLPLALADRPAQAEVSLLWWLREQSGQTLDALLALATLSARGPTLFAVDVLIALLALWIAGRRHALFFGASVALAGLFSLIGKRAVGRVRPSLWESAFPESSFSFPSGHAMGSMALFVALLALLWRTPYRWIALLVGGIWVLAVGLSRSYFGVHYPSDVLAGWFAAVACVAYVKAWLDPYPYGAERRSRPRNW